MFDDFSIYDTMSLVGIPSSSLKGSSGYIDCPYCGGKKKFNINATVGHGGVCRCAKCSVGGDKLDLFILCEGRGFSLVNTQSQSGKTTYLRPSDDDRKWALREVEDRLHIKRKDSGYLKKMAMLRKQAEEAAAKVSNSSRPPQEISEVYTAFLKLLKLSPAHRMKLLERGLTEEDIERIMFRSVPPFGRAQYAKKLIEQGYDLENIPGFFKLIKQDEKTGEVTEEWSVYCPSDGYFVPIRDIEGNLVFMQIRLNKPTTDNNKYLSFSSSKETLADGTKADNETHVEMCEDEPKYLYIVEGAIKAHVAHALYKRIYGRDDIIILATPGTSNIGRIPQLMEKLSRYNFVSVIEFFDLDKFSNTNVARDRDNLEKLLKHSMTKWKQEKSHLYQDDMIKEPTFISFSRKRYRGKGIDDHLKVIYDELVEKERGVT